MSFEGPVINKLNGGLGRTNLPSDNVFAIVLGAVAIGSSFELNKPYRLLSPDDAEAIGINSAYDANNDILVKYHIDEFFRLAPDAELYIMGVAQGTTQSEMVNKTTGKLRELIMSDEANRKIRYCGTVLNPATSYSPSVTDNIDADVINAVAVGQKLIDDLFAGQIYIDGILIEGRNFGSNISSATDLRTLNAGNISVCIGSDPAIQSLSFEYVGTACVGAALGMLAVRDLSENLGSVDIKNKPANKKGQQSYPLTSNTKFLSSALSGGTKTSTLTLAQLKDLTAKGYIFTGTYEGFAGVFFNNAPTCTELASDYAYIENNRIWNKAARVTRATLIPKMKSTVKLDTDTGYIRSSSASGLEAVVNQALKTQMIDTDLCSDAICFINPNQSVSNDEPLNVRVKVVKDGIIHAMSVDIGLTDTI